MPEYKKEVKLDANDMAFFADELENVKSQTYDIVYERIKFRDLLPIDRSASPADNTITFRRYGKVGTAKFVSDYATDFPKADIYAEEVSSNIKSIGTSYDYSIQEIRASRETGKNLDARKAESCRRAIEEKLDSIAWTGNKKRGLQGFFNYPGISEYTVPAGASTKTEFDEKTPLEIVADFHGLISAIIVTTNEMESPNTIILPLEQYLYLSATPMSTDNDKTILTYLLETLAVLGITTIEKLSKLKAAGPTGKDMMMAYENTMDKLAYQLPQDFEQIDEDKVGMAYTIPCHARSGGMTIYYPQSVAFAEGI